MLRRLLPRFPLFRPSRPVLPTLAPRALYRVSPPRLAQKSPRLGENVPPLPPNPSVSERLKHLVKSYGWYALGVYLVFSALDFTVAFVGINLLGAEQVSQAAAYVKQLAFGLFSSKPPEPGSDEVDPAAAGTGGHEGLYAMLVLAYTVHKTVFLPVRVGLTAALTPRIVGWLRARGWAGGDGAMRAVRGMKERSQISKGPD